MNTSTRARAISGSIAALAGTAALLFLSGCAEQDKPHEIQVDLDGGGKASCIVIEDDTGAIEEMVCDWPDKK